MYNLTVNEILEATNGKLIQGDKSFVCKNFSKDTRTITKDDVYIAMKGERFDGNLFWKSAFENGAKVAIIEKIELPKKDLEKWQDKIIIQVEDTMQALYKIASKKRELYGKEYPVIGITGSVGKTSTKDMIASVISQKYKTLKTEGNNNNNIGLPFTILRWQEEEVAVLEMGMNHFGEISLLTNIAKPTISVITNIGTSHIGNLGSRENILKAKLEILEGMENPLLVINNDNDLLHNWQEKNCEKIMIKTYGIENDSEVWAENIVSHENDSEFTCHLGNEQFDVKVPVGGMHFVLNALCAATVGKILGLTKEEIKKGIESFELTKKRMEILSLKDGIRIINDSYNASFESMQASLAVLGGFQDSRKIAVLGDMFELGDFAKSLHEKVGAEVVKNKIDILICHGENAKYIAEEAKEEGMQEGNIYCFSKKEEIIPVLEKIVKTDDVLLFKASNGMRFFDLVEELKRRKGE